MVNARASQMHEAADKSESPIVPLGDRAQTDSDDSFPAVLSFLAFIAGVALTTVIFPALVYYSVVCYGLLASGFLAAGYVAWRSLARTNPKKATGFLIGFTPLVIFSLIPYLFVAPGLVGMIVAEFAVFCLAMRSLDQFRRMR